MSRDKANPDPSYAVGYGRPPKETRFKPGETGNPRGRPRRTPSIEESLRTVIEEKVSIVDENGKSQRVTVLEAACRGLAMKAVGGDSTAVKSLFELIQRHGAAPSTAPQSMRDSEPYKRLMLLGSSPDDQQKAAATYQQLIRGSQERAKERKR